jgi:Flp pilus assembly protein TadB
MRAGFNSTVLQRNLLLTIPVAAIAWLVAVPGFLTLSSFVVLTGLLAVLAWVVKTIYSNAQPTCSLVQLVHESDPAARNRATKTR